MPRPATRDPLPPADWPFPGRGVKVHWRKAARLLGVSRATIYRMAANGEVRSTGAGKGLRINLSDLFVRAFYGGPDRSRWPIPDRGADAGRLELHVPPDSRYPAVFVAYPVQQDSGRP